MESDVIDTLASYKPISDILGLEEDDECHIYKFNKAFQNGDIEKLVELCYSTTPIQKLENKLHTWAENPKTIGALSATQLSVYASKESIFIQPFPLIHNDLSQFIISDEPEFKDDILAANGIEALADLLKSEVNSKCCEEMYEQDVFPYLIKGMKSSLDPFRAACAQTCRNIYYLGIYFHFLNFKLDIKYRKEFMRLGGLVALVSLLNLSDDSDEMYLTQLEAIYHLEDFCMDGIEEIPELVEYVKASNALSKLQSLEKVHFT
ncbi:uncharacterized protein TA05340 [Theileria annulata]|uniref:Uncharacterized protein n=1 Tax=Theileria annulata TaxID=5874 RepID=Q4UCT6_THEAN|nr:uncharacterized protein TA05340 [Theileria annulata]CAI75365.1 hypothetical protein, conserved [Theileria annulata]|eukprot:XP_954841.1 hypothetical protein, conserved [Theileria annulata]